MLRQHKTRKSLDKIFNQQCVTSKDGRKVCPECKGVTIERENYNQAKVGGWTIIPHKGTEKARLACQACYTRKLKPLKINKKNEIARERLEDPKFKEKPVILSEKTNRKKEWVPLDKKKKVTSVKKFTSKISAADKIRQKAASIKSQYR